MVKITNKHGDVKRGKQGEAVYQNVYGRQVRRRYNPHKNARTEAQTRQRERFKESMLFAANLTKPERDFLKSYFDEAGITGKDGLPITPYNFTRQIAMTKPKVAATVKDTGDGAGLVLRSFTIRHPAIKSFEILDDGYKEEGLSNLTDLITSTVRKDNLDLQTTGLKVTTLADQTFIFPLTTEFLMTGEIVAVLEEIKVLIALIEERFAYPDDYPDADAKGVLDNLLTELTDKFDSIHDYGTGKTSLCVTRGGGKKTITAVYLTNQTNKILLACAENRKIQIVGAYISTSSNTGLAVLAFLSTAPIIFPLYAAKYQHDGQEDMALEGYPGESVTLTSTTAEEPLFLLINYRILEAVAEDYQLLTVEDWRANPATGTCTLPAFINNNNLGMSAIFDEINETAQVEFTKPFTFNKYRYYGDSIHAGDGDYVLQYKSLTTNAWITIASGIPTRDDTWSDWIPFTAVNAKEIRIIATALDTGDGSNRAAEWELKHEA